MQSKWQEFWSSPFGKGLLAVLRNVLIVAVGLLVTGLLEYFTTAEMNPVIQMLVIAGLKLIDELLHKTGVAERGLTRF